MHTADILTSFPKAIVLGVDANHRVHQGYGEQLNLLYSASQSIQHKTLLEIFHEDIYKKIKSLIDARIDSLNITFMHRNYDVFYQNGFLYFVDISRYNSVESQLKQSVNDLSSKKEELQAVFDMAANGISILDHNGMFLYANRFFQEMMGYTMEELYAESCISLSAPEYATASETAVDKAIKYGSIQNFRKVCITKSGEHLNASMSLSYLKSRDEIVMITSDITQDIKYQDELKRQVEIEVAKQTQQYEIMCHQSRLAAMGEMIDSIAHQWRQPLNGLGLIIQGLRHISDNNILSKKLIEEIEDEMMEKVSYMSQTIDDFSSFFRISKKKESFDVLHSIEDAIRLIDVQLKSNAVEVKIILENGTPRNVVGFPNEFKQVIMNIVHNAMTAITGTPKKEGLIRIGLSFREGKLHICISDNGGGIDEENIEKIFDPYFTTREKGSGIGLYMSKVIIEHHMQGSLNVQNHNEGTMFCIELKYQENK